MPSKSKGREFLGKTIVSEEAGRKFGAVGDLVFAAESGELMHIVLVEPTRHIMEINLEKDSAGRHLIPFSAVKSVGDFVIISEREMV